MEILNEFESRQKKVQKIREGGRNPYPAQPNIDRTDRQSFLFAVRERFQTLMEKKTSLWVAGRVRSKREHGGSAFFVIEDESARIQLYLKRDVIGDDFAFWKDALDLGDFVEAQGTAFLTKTGEQTIQVKALHLLSKAILPLPEQWHGLSDVEVRYRKRYLDLLANPLVRENAKKRSMVISAIREFLDRHFFIEVETPILQPIPGGALAKPFMTHHNALDADLYMRVAPELYLKRLIVGGLERVYEIARCFRNEGIDHSHNPEFTQVEFYYAYIDYRTLMEFTEQLLLHVVQQVGPVRIPYGVHELDFTPPYPRVTFRESLQRYAGIDIEEFTDIEKFAEASRKKGCDVTAQLGFGKIADELFKTIVRPKIIQPTFIIDHPLELSPLAKKKENDPRYVERFQLLLGPGIELCNAFSELNDPEDQERRFRDQERLRASGDDEAMPFDDDFIEALQYGMPPTAGFGMGIDRLVAILTNSHNLKEIILFPTLKPKMEKPNGGV